MRHPPILLSLQDSTAQSYKTALNVVCLFCFNNTVYLALVTEKGLQNGGLTNRGMTGGTRAGTHMRC